MSAVNPTGRTGASSPKPVFESNRGSGQPVAVKSFSRERSEASSVDKMHPRLARFFGRNEPSASNHGAIAPYVRHHVNVDVNPSAPPAHLMSQQALQPQHRNVVVPSAPPMELLPQQALQPMHRVEILPNGFQQLERR